MVVKKSLSSEKTDGLPRVHGKDMLASRFFVRILRFLQAKILGFFSCLSDKDVQMQSLPCPRSAHQIF